MTQCRVNTFNQFINCIYEGMNSEITLENYPPTVIIYERPEFKDAVSWMILSIAILIVIDIGLFVSNPNLVLPGSLAILVIITPFFINRYAIKKDSVGGESFKMEKTERKSIIYKNKEFSIEEVSFELITRKMNYGNTYLLYMISNHDQRAFRPLLDSIQ